MLGIDDNIDIIEGADADELYEKYVSHFGTKPHKVNFKHGKKT